PEPPRTRPPLDVPFAPANSPSEARLLEIWQQILELTELGIDDPFLDLGGDSLSASRILARGIDAFGVDVPLRAFFESPTIRHMARVIDDNAAAGPAEARTFAHGEGHLERRRSAEPQGEIPHLAPVARDGVLPLSFAQERLWFLHQFEPASTVYNLPWILR